MAKAVKELRDAIENMPEGNDSEKRRKKEVKIKRETNSGFNTIKFK